MFAILRTGGKQYKVSANDKITVAKLDANEGDKVTLEDILLVGDEKSTKLGNDVSNAKVVAEVVKQTRGDRVLVFKKRRRQNSRRKNGHRQDLTVISIKEIKVA
jgi:large subunit ribosomal protein L21